MREIATGGRAVEGGTEGGSCQCHSPIPGINLTPPPGAHCVMTSGGCHTRLPAQQLQETET